MRLTCLYTIIARGIMSHAIVASKCGRLLFLLYTLRERSFGTRIKMLNEFWACLSCLRDYWKAAWVSSATFRSRSFSEFFWLLAEFSLGRFASCLPFSFLQCQYLGKEARITFHFTSLKDFGTEIYLNFELSGISAQRTIWVDCFVFQSLLLRLFTVSYCFFVQNFLG